MPRSEFRHCLNRNGVDNGFLELVGHRRARATGTPLSREDGLWEALAVREGGEERRRVCINGLYEVERGETRFAGAGAATGAERGRV